MQTSASAKIILLGEHAVVYGQPSIAAPVSSLRAYATIQKNSPGDDDLHIVAEDIGQKLTFRPGNFNENPILMLVSLLLKHIGASPPAITIHLHSQIPMASGLGSGAAISTALVRALLLGLNTELEDEAINQIVYEIEKLHHGTPSGIDNTVIVYENPVYFVRDKPIEHITIGNGVFDLLIGDTGEKALTHISVGDVRRLYDQEPERIGKVITCIGELVTQARPAIEQGNLTHLGWLMNENHRYLQALTVSSPTLDKLVTSARDAGALGAKLSGGGRGGNMIALVEQVRIDSVKQALYEAGAVQVYQTRLGEI